MTPFNAFLAICIMLLWGLNFVFFKIINEELPLFTLMAMRFALVALCLVPFFKKPPAPIKDLVLIAFIFSIPHAAANFGGMVVGLDAGMATLVEQTNAPFLLLLNAFIHKEKIGIRSIIGIVLSFIGTYFLMQAPTSLEAPLGFALVLCGAFFWGVYSLLLKRVGQVNPLAMIGWMALFSAPINAVVALLFESNQLDSIAHASATSWMVLLYMVVGASFGAHALWYYLISKVRVEELAPTTLMVPFFGVMGGVLLLNEPLSFEMVVGGIILIVGVAVVLIRRPKMLEKDIDVGA